MAVRRLALPTLAALLGAAVLGLLVYGVSTKSANTSLDDAVAHGQRPPAPQRLLPLLAGSGERSLADYRGKVVVLNFWASWCAPCAAEAPLLERAQNRLAAHGGTVLGVTYLDATPDALGFVRQYRLTYPNLRDISGNYAHSYGTDLLPETFVIDRQGHVEAISRGEINQGFLNRAVALAETT
jgi:cytochrome c biogenesis protein CcmG, thiol:disulfide interchange protein DsbE